MENKPNKLTITLDFKWISLFLLAVITGMLLVWRPWEGRVSSSSRTIDVTGEATVKAEPDQYVFYPNYEFSNADKTAALNQLKAKSDELVKKLKELGVEDNNIKTNTDGYDKYYIAPEGSNTPTYTLRLEVTLSDKDKTQKVQDYLITTAPQGSVSPQYSFSDAKRKELESQARDQATKDARSKADQSAKNLGFKVGAVKSVNDGAGFGGVMPMGCSGGLCASSTAELKVSDSSAGSSLGIQPGQNDIQYSVSVSYYLK